MPLDWNGPLEFSDGTPIVRVDGRCVFTRTLPEGWPEHCRRSDRNGTFINEDGKISGYHRGQTPLVVQNRPKERIYYDGFAADLEPNGLPRCS